MIEQENIFKRARKLEFGVNEYFNENDATWEEFNDSDAFYSRRVLTSSRVDIVKLVVQGIGDSHK